MTISKTILSSLTLLTIFAFSGCSDNDNKNTSVTPTLTPEQEKVIKDYVKPTTGANGEKIEAIDPLVELLSE